MDSSCICAQLLPWTIAVVSTSYALYLMYQNSQGGSSGCCKKKAPFNTKQKTDSPKVVDNFDIEDMDQKTVFCRCWQSKKFPYCDGSHNDYNKETGDNLGPLIVQKKQ